MTLYGEFPDTKDDIRKGCSKFAFCYTLFDFRDRDAGLRLDQGFCLRYSEGVMPNSSRKQALKFPWLSIPTIIATSEMV